MLAADDDPRAVGVVLAARSPIHQSRRGSGTLPLVVRSSDVISEDDAYCHAGAKRGALLCWPRFGDLNAVALLPLAVGQRA